MKIKWGNWSDGLQGATVRTACTKKGLHSRLIFIDPVWICRYFIRTLLRHINEDFLISRL